MRSIMTAKGTIEDFFTLVSGRRKIMFLKTISFSDKYGKEQYINIEGDLSTRYSISHSKYEYGRPNCLLTELNKPNSELMGKALINLYRNVGPEVHKKIDQEIQGRNTAKEINMEITRPYMIES